LDWAFFYVFNKFVRQGVASAQAARRKGSKGCVTGYYLVITRAFLYHLANFLRGSNFYLKA